MFSKDEILAQLRDGVDASDIAQKMADNINAALDEYKAEQEAAKRDETRRGDAREMVKAMNAFFSKYSDEAGMSEEDIERAVDGVMELMDSLDELRTALEKETAPAPERKPIGTKAKTDEEALKAFLQSLR